MAFAEALDAVVERPAVAGPDPRGLLDLGQIEGRWDPENAAIWGWMRPRDRPNFNPAMLSDIGTFQDSIEREHKAGRMPAKWQVLGSRFPGFYNLGGDLDLFAQKILDGDREALMRYGKACVHVLHRSLTGMGVPIVTVTFVQGAAFGGGFECALSFNVLIAERGARFGLPESTFGLFPGMGAHALLVRKVGSAMAERMILSGDVYTAEQMYDMGVVTVLADEGRGEEAARDYIRKNGRKHPGQLGIFRATQQVAPITKDELDRIVELWVESALSLGTKNVRLMRKLVAAQDRLNGFGGR